MEYLYGIVIIVGLYVVLATSFNLIIGYGGLVSIAHPVFFALGAYASALLSRDVGIPVLLAMIAGMLVAVVASIAMALPRPLATRSNPGFGGVLSASANRR